jgi:alkylation response protein AidB-like acyl-CoA dehydrogenase
MHPMTVWRNAEVDHWLNRARALAPLVERSREEGEAQRRLPHDLFTALRDAGLFSLWVPRSLGGAEVEVETSVRVVEELSRHDASVGWNVMIAANTSILWANLEPRVAKEMAKGATVIAGTVTAGSGTATPVPGGFVVTGRWPFASGCHQADWLVSVCHIVEDGEPRRAPNGAPLTYTFVLPASACTIIDTWHTLGMRGTGSHDFCVDGLFVPESHHFPSRAPSWETGPLYNTSLFHLWGPNIAAVALGTARDAIDTFVSLARTKTPVRASTVLSERETVQERLGRAEALLRSGRSMLLETIQQTWALLRTDREVPEELTALNRLATSTAVDHAVAAVSSVFTMAGSSSIYETSRLERCLRDVHVIRQHAVVGASGFTTAGRWLLGLELGPGR